MSFLKERTSETNLVSSQKNILSESEMSSKMPCVDITPLETSIIVFVPYCDIYKPYIIICLESIRTQAYGDIQVIIVNDGSADTVHIDDYIRDKPIFKMIHRDTNGGPAASKWTFMEYLQNNRTMYTMNDIVFIIDGDDYLIDDKVFYTINETYHQYKCWVTYGDAEGKFCETNKIAIPEDWSNFRKERWIYNHPRTFKLGLAMTFVEDDFKKDGVWLTKGTDRPIVYNCIEMAGKERVQYINKIMYKYVEHELNSYKTVNFQSKKAQLDYVMNIEPKTQIVEDIHIVMCYWQRPNHLEVQLNNLNNQTVAKRIHLHILNNNVHFVKYLNETLEKIKPKFTNIKVTMKHYKNEWYAFQRFLYIRDNLVPNYLIDYAIMMDDDSTWADDWVENMYKLRKPKTYTCWFGKKWTMDNIDYWEGSIIQTHECKYLKKLEIRDFHYGGTGGAIIDVNIFLKNSELWKIPNDLPEDTIIYNIEDLWLSFIMRKLYAWTIPRAYLVDKGLFRENTLTNKTALWKTLRQPKSKLLVYLVNKYGL
jgi:glycosyltransferase involved in cell wall biosynthesis